VLSEGTIALRLFSTRLNGFARDHTSSCNAIETVQAPLIMPCSGKTLTIFMRRKSECAHRSRETLRKFDVLSCIAATLAGRLNTERAFAHGRRLYFIFWKLKMFLAERDPVG
jgi:hypothetical protein